MFNKENKAEQVDVPLDEEVQAKIEGTAPKSNARFGEIPEGFMNIKGAAADSGLSDLRIRTLLRDGRLPGARKEESGRWLIPHGAIKKYQETKGRRTDGASFVIRVPNEKLEAVKKFMADQEIEMKDRYPKKATAVASDVTEE